MELSIDLTGKNLAEQLGISTQRGEQLVRTTADCYDKGKHMAVILQAVAAVCVLEEELIFCSYIIGALDGVLPTQPS